MIKGYPRSRFEIIDQTNIQEIPTYAISPPIPMPMAVYTSDKGSEDWRIITSLDSFMKETGSMSFTKHGQPQLTVAEELRSGAVVFCKRMVSNNATLANTTVRARVVNSDNVSYVYFYTKSGTNIGNFDDACNAGYDNFDAEKAIIKDGESVDIPLFTITPMGRGTSNMFFRLNPEYTSSKSSTYIRYSFEIYENQELIESILFTMNPDIIIDGVAQALNPKVKANSKQVKVNMYEDGIYAFIKAIAKTAVNGDSAIPISSLINMDIINAMDIRGQNAIGGVVVRADASSTEEDLWSTNKPSDISTVYDLSSDIGIPLANGSYGTMGDTPIGDFNSTHIYPEEYENMLLETFGAFVNPEDVSTIKNSHLFDSVIYDLDAYKVDFICDCSYPLSVKKAIINLVDYRQDLVYLADLGMNTLVESEHIVPNNAYNIVKIAKQIPYSRFTAIYHNYFKIYDPYTSKQIMVTMPYLLAKRLINHCINGVGRPFAGILHGITFPEIIEGSINFLPVEIPGIDQKQQLIDANVNYISLYDKNPVMETMYINCSNYTQLSYIHNIMAIQEVIKAVRTRCPRTRYTFMDGTDLQRYIDDATLVINQYATNFKSIEMEYMADERYESNNIFYATIRVQFKNFIQEEYFKVIAID